MSVNDALLVLKKIGTAYNEMCRPILCEFSIPQIEFDIIMILSSNPEYNTAKNVCEVIHAKANLMSLHVDKLVQSGYIERCTDDCDRRKIKLSCTDKALPIIEKGREIKKSFLIELCKNLSEDQLAEFYKVLNVIGSNADNISNRKHQ